VKKKGLDVVYIQYYETVLRLETCFYRDGIAFDAFVPQFREIVRRATSVLNGVDGWRGRGYGCHCIARHEDGVFVKTKESLLDWERDVMTGRVVVRKSEGLR
jgi:hypothetical protein